MAHFQCSVCLLTCKYYIVFSIVCIVRCIGMLSYVILHFVYCCIVQHPVVVRSISLPASGAVLECEGEAGGGAEDSLNFQIPVFTLQNTKERTPYIQNTTISSQAFLLFDFTLEKSQCRQDMANRFYTLYPIPYRVGTALNTYQALNKFLFTAPPMLRCTLSTPNFL